MYLNQFRLISRFGLSLSAFALVLLGCKTTLQQDRNNEQLHKIATDKLGSVLDSLRNSTGEYVLYIQKASPTNTSSYLKLLVIHVADQRIVHEESFKPGYAKWITDSSIEVLSIPGMIRENQSLADFKKVITLKPVKN